ncbi:MAG: DUF547 domain-containing protein [Armatimonadota bacterium]|nr:DUF547 domain-containing protein [Armatimonadota bacterium]
MHYRAKQRLFWTGTVPLFVLMGGAIMSGGSSWADAPTAAPADTAAADNAATDTPAEDATEAIKPEDFPQGLLFPYYLLDAALNKRVDTNGTVDYAALKGNKYLDLFIKAVATADLSQFPSIDAKEETTDPKTGKTVTKIVKDRSAELTFWINAYNAHVLKALSDAFPVSSPDAIPDFYTAKTRRVAGKDWSLADLHRDIVKRDPRAFFALIDGTRSGPMAPIGAYKYRNLDQTLDEAAMAFVSDPRNVQLLRIEDTVTLNPLFAQVNTLFQPAATRGKFEGIKRVLAAYTQRKPERNYYATNDFKVQWKRPDRSLNKLESQGPITGPGISGP